MIDAQEVTHKSYAKCILAGEHSVLRGFPALVFPVKGCGLTSHFKMNENSLQVFFTGPAGSELSLIFWGVLEEACRKLSLDRKNLKGTWTLENDIAIGGGLGASAAICVTVSRLFADLGYLPEADIYQFSRELENLFHGESSGVDIAASMSEGGIKFLRSGQRSLLENKWQPKIYVSYSGIKGITADCVAKVKNLLKENPHLGRAIDEQMGLAVQGAQEALKQNESEGLKNLVKHIIEASDCFEKWGLVNSNLQEHMNWLKSLGALAVKPTGSGGGGYVLSLWDREPLDQNGQLFKGLIPVQCS